MQASDQANERLHQQASGQYLQGKFEEALATWKQILANDPEDERAGEGVRLCELLTEDGAAAAAAAAAAGEAPTTEAAPANEPASAVLPEEELEFELPNLDLDLPAIEPPDPMRQSDGIDFGGEPEVLGIDGEIPEAPVPEPTVEIEAAIPESDGPPAEAEVGPVVDGIFDEDTPSAAGTAGAAELGKRTQDLVSEARAAHESGDVETARSVLKRVFILDEGNAEARELQEQIENGVPPATESADLADLDAPDYDATPGEFDLAADAPGAAAEELQLEGQASAAAPAVVPEPVPAIPEDPAEDDFPDFDVDAEFEESEDDEELESDDVETAKGIRLPQFDAGSSKTRWIVIGVVVGIFVVVAVGFWMKLRAIDDVEAPPPIVQTEPTAAEAAGEPVAETQPAPVEPGPAAEVAAAPTEPVATLLARGNAALDAGEYSKAVLAFDSVLKQEPDNFEANERLQTASAGYRAQQEIQQQWMAATSLFRDGEFRSAMQMFYRLPQDTEDDRVRIARYQENGWFNMGLLALRSGQCDLARSHFSEASQIDPEDADVAMALALCDTCEGGTRRTGFQRAVAAMKMRGLDD